MTTLYVGNLPYSISDVQLRERFATYGRVVGARIALDRQTQRPRGFGFVEMATEAEARAASHALHDSAFHGRKLVVNAARPKVDAYVPGRPR